MSDEKTESTGFVADASVPVQPEAPASRETVTDASSTEKPRRRARKPKADVDAAQAEGSDEEKKPRRTRRTKKEGDAPAEGEVSEEVAQARALAKVSQASVVRKQRRAAERAAEALESPDAAPAPVPVDGAAAGVPLVDPALRPHRRGRKPKAYVEAERAAAAALAAAAAEGAEPAPAAAADGAPAEDVRPGRARRAADEAPKKATSRRRRKADADDAAPAEGKALAADGAAETAGAADGGREDEPQDKAPRDKGVKDGKHAKDGGKDGSRDGKGDKDSEGDAGRDTRRTHASRRERERERRDERRQRQKDRKQQRNNRFNGPTEPSLSRDDLAAMKVAELRQKARELEIDVTGKRKAELVEEVYLAAARAEGFRDIAGILDISREGFGHIRAHGYMPSRDDAFVPANMIRAARLRPGDYITGSLRPSRQGDKYPGLAKITSVNGLDPEEVKNRPKFSDLTPIYPNERLKMEHGKDSITGRAIDIVAPVGKGQRGLIVSPPKAGKTTILKKICQSIAVNNPEVHLICLLVDERPEEVTDMQRSIKGEVVASTFDMPADNHTRVSELVIERAKRLVELGEDVVVVLDSITRLARAYNLAAPASGRILSGGVDSAALYPPKRFLGAARNIENGGSLTILASALIETGSKMDEVIFEEFKGTGNMELKLDRELADRRIFPAIDPVASGTRNEDLLIDEQMRPFVWGIRRILANMSNVERCASSFIKGLKNTNSNEEFLIRSAKRAAEHGELIK